MRCFTLDADLSQSVILGNAKSRVISSKVGIIHQFSKRHLLMWSTVFFFPPGPEVPINLSLEFYSGMVNNMERDIFSFSAVRDV